MPPQSAVAIPAATPSVATSSSSAIDFELISAQPDATSVHTPMAPRAPISYGGYACTSNCSGHEAGHEWAEENGIDNEDDCSGNSESFIEGCKSYVEEQAGAQAEEEAEGPEAETE